MAGFVSRPVSDRPRVVGVGASAGGVEAVQEFLAEIAAGRQLAIVIVFHLDPAAGNVLPQQIQQATSLRVVEVLDEAPVRPDTVYVAPGRAVVTVNGGVFRLVPAEKSDNRAPIDRFLHSLAQDYGNDAIAVVLSGTGSDGALGLKAVAEAGGLTLVQEPGSARFDSMPQSALATGAVDQVLSPRELGRELMSYARYHLQIEPSESDLRQEIQDTLPAICDHLLQTSGHNFRHYKTSTLVRRTQRRLQVLRLKSAREYLERLRSDPAQGELLFRDLLIGVTAFFRDPDAFEALARDVFPALLENRKPDDPVRIWVPGCASGQEPYSLAMLLKELLDQHPHPPEVQIFATDIDEQSLSFGRLGQYPLGIADEISPERLRRFFTRKNGQFYQINKDLREMVLFSVHNLINDPPFSRLDLISCRNLLIYLGQHLQNKLLPLFHYALKPGGYLFLGPSENLTAHRELFRSLDARHRISQRLPTVVRAADVVSSRPATLSLPRPPNVASTGETDIYLLMQQIVLDEFAPKTVVVNDDGQIVCASGNLETYLTVSAGVFHNHLVRLAREGLRLALRTALSEAARQKRKVVHDGASVHLPEGIQRVMVTVQPMPQMGENSGLYLVVFQDVGTPIATDDVSRITSSENASALVEQLERELSTVRQDLEKTVQDLETVNEELKSGNEELLSMNEELQSANEELETSKEEVLRAHDELARANGDLENLLASISIATIFLDEGGHVRRVTPAIGEVYNITPEDIGRPLSHFTHRARHMPPLPRIEDVVSGVEIAEEEIETDAGSWFLRRVLPYRTQEGRVEGLVITFIDVTARRRAEQALRDSEARTRSFLENSATVAWMKNREGQYVYVSPNFERRFNVHFAGDHLKTDFDLWPPERAEQMRCSDHQVLESNQRIEFRKEIDLPDGQRTFWWACKFPLSDSRGDQYVGALAVDITEQVLVEDALKESEQQLRRMADAMPQIVWTAGPDGAIDYYNERWYEFTGLPRDSFGDDSWVPLLHPDDVERTVQTYYNSIRNGQPYQIEYRLKDRASGGYRWFLGRALPARDHDGHIIRWFGTSTDIDDTKAAEEIVREANRRKEEFLAMLAHELRNPLAPIRNAVTILQGMDVEEPRFRWCREVLGRQSEQLARLVDDLLDISRITRGKVNLQKHPIEVAAVIRQAVETSQPLIDARRHRLALHIPRDPVWIEGDLTRLAQVIANLLNNAAKYTEERGEITVAADCHDHEVCIRVRDTGRGIDPAVVPNLFDLFYQVDRNLDRAEGGLGIGLSLVRRLVELHGGRVLARSDGRGRGSEFLVYLPRLENGHSDEPVEPLPTASPVRCGLKVIIVDDNDDAAHTMALLLRIDGHDVTTAHDGHRGLEVAHARKPDVILLDIGLPGIDGYEVCRTLRKQGFHNTLIVAMTGYGQDTDRQQSREAGFDAHLVKPADIEEVRALLTSWNPD